MSLREWLARSKIEHPLSTTDRRIDRLVYEPYGPAE